MHSLTLESNKISFALSTVCFSGIFSEPAFNTFLRTNRKIIHFQNGIYYFITLKKITSLGDYCSIREKEMKLSCAMKTIDYVVQ